MSQYAHLLVHYIKKCQQQMHGCGSIRVTNHSIKVYTIRKTILCLYMQSVRPQLQQSLMTLSYFQGVSMRGVFPIGTLGRYPRLCPRRFRLEHRFSFSERSAHSRTSLPLPTTTALVGAHRIIPEAV